MIVNDLLVTGSGRFVDKVYANEFEGDLVGNAETATSADWASGASYSNMLKKQTRVSTQAEMDSFGSADGVRFTTFKSDDQSEFKDFNYSDGMLLSIPWSIDYGAQLAFDDTQDGNMFVRGKSSNTWGSWKKLLHSGNFTSVVTPSAIGAAASGHSHTVVNGVTPEWSGSISYANTDYVAAWTGDGTKLKALAKSSFAPASHTHNYAGSSSAGGAATSANKLNTYAVNSITVPSAGWYVIASSTADIRGQSEFYIYGIGSSVVPRCLHIWIDNDWGKGTNVINVEGSAYDISKIRRSRIDSTEYIEAYFERTLGEGLQIRVDNASFNPLSNNNLWTWGSGELTQISSPTIVQSVDVKTGYSTSQTMKATTFEGNLVGNASTSTIATAANSLNYTSTDEINFTGSSSNANVYFNYRGSNGTSGNTAITKYYFCNRNTGHSDVQLVAGSFSGNASSATKATQDASGNTITSTYATKTELNNKSKVQIVRW